MMSRETKAWNEGFQTGFSKGWEACWHREHPAIPPAHPFAMFDSVDVGQIPGEPQAVAGYVGGHWPNYNELVRRFPRAKHLSIAVNAGENAECLDVEQGDAAPSQVGAWVHRQQQRGIRRPVLYCSLSVVASVVGYLERSGIGRQGVRIWSAHYTGQPHICDRLSCGWGAINADATQWTDHALGRNLDESLCTPTFL